MNRFRKVCEKNVGSTGHWTDAQRGFNNNLLNDTYKLRAHAELLNNDFPLFEGRPYGLKSITQLCSTCPSLRNNEISIASAGNLTLDEGSGGMKMKKWNDYTEFELEQLSFGQLTDVEIAAELNQFSEQWNFTAMSVKRKRHRLKLLKKEDPVVNDITFNIKVSKKKKGLGFVAAYMPLPFVNKFDIKEDDLLLFKKNEKFFFSKIRRILRTDRPNDYYAFGIPFKLIKSTRFNEEQVEYIGKVNCRKEKTNLIHDGQVDVLALLEKKINKRVQICLQPYDSSKVLISTERAAVPIELTRYISLSQELFQCLGFFQGEGTKGNLKRVEIVNTDVSLLNKFLDLFRNDFEISNSRWKARVTYTKESKNEILEKELVNYWSEQLDIPAVNFVKSHWMKGTPDALKGGVQLYLSNYSLREVWMNLIRLSHKMVCKDKNYAKWFLQGVMAADGCPRFSKGVLRDAMIRIENGFEGQLYSCALKKLKINSSVSVEYRSVIVRRLDELNKIHQFELFKLHKERNEKFQKGLVMRKR